jgi:prepilin-type N-terminal cleavage/methylation domain-containing protein
MRSVPNRGVTLVELLVVLALLGLVFGISGLALASLREPRESDDLRDLQKARAEAVQSGSPRAAHGVLFLPDGRAIGPNVDPLTGAPRAP